MNDCLCYNLILCNDLTCTCTLRDRPRRIHRPPIAILIVGFDVSSFPIICAKKNKTIIRHTWWFPVR